MNNEVVFDCNIFAQALLSPAGPAARCLELAQAGHVQLFVSEYVLEEISELHLKLPARAGITADDTEDLALLVRSFAKMLDPVPAIFIHPIDPDDSEYVNLALAAKADVVVSRDKHLLGLNDLAKPWSKEFRDRFPALRVFTPDEYLVERQKQRDDVSE